VLGEQRYDREREARRQDRATAVEALEERRTTASADVVATRDEPEAGAESDERAPEEAERRVGGGERDRVADRDEGEADERRVARPEAVGGPTAGDLHRHVHEKLHRCEEPDRRQADPVRMGEARGDRAERGDVPADRDADADAADGRARPDPTSMLHGRERTQRRDRCPFDPQLETV